MRQNDLFGMLPKRVESSNVNQGIAGAMKRVDNSKKYVPAEVLPQYSVLRQRIILIENIIRSGRLVKEDSYFTLRDKESLQTAMNKIRECKVLAWDCEFDSLNYSQAKLVGLSFYEPIEEKSYYVPFIHCDTQRNILENQLTYEEFIEVAGDVFSNPDIKKITHQYNACDNQVFEYNTGVRILGQYWDTLLFINAIDENHQDNSLKKQYAEFILETDGKEETFESLFDGISFAFVPIDIGMVYACKDAKMTYELYQWQKKKLSASEYKAMLKHYIEIEVKQIEVVAAMQIRGIKISRENAKTLEAEYITLLAEIKLEMDNFFRSKYGVSNINYSSPDQVGRLLYDSMKLESVDKKAPRGTGEEILNKLIEKHPELIMLKKLGLYRSTSKLLNTYLQAIPQQANSEDILRGKFHSHGARTGRYSSSEPNLQNIPSHFNDQTGKDDSRIRSIFVPRPGYVWLSADYSQIEPRILAYRCNDFIMLEAYKTGKDLYSMMASDIYQLTYEECLESHSPEAKYRRTSVKSVLLGLMYGRQAKSIGEQIGLTAKEAQQFVENFFGAYPNIKKYIDETVRMGTLVGYVTTIYDRRRRLTGLNSPNEYLKAEAQRQGVNASIQGSSADITKKAMVNLYNNTWLKENDCHLLLTIHDEVVLEVPETIKEKAAHEIKNCLIAGAEILSNLMPIKVDIEVFEKAWNIDSYKLKV